MGIALSRSPKLALMITMHMCLDSKHSKGMGKEKVVLFSLKLLGFLVKKLGAMPK